MKRMLLSIGRKTSDLATKEEVLMNPAAFVQRKERGWTGCGLTQKLEELSGQGLKVVKCASITISDSEEELPAEKVPGIEEAVEMIEPAEQLEKLEEDDDDDMFAPYEEEEHAASDAEVEDAVIEPVDDTADDGDDENDAAMEDTAALAGAFAGLHNFSSSDDEFEDSGML